MQRPVLFAALAMSLLSPLEAAPAASPISYVVRFPAPQTNYAEVEMTFAPGQPSVEVMMAVWTPGSYLVREYSRNLEAITARTASGEPLMVEKTRKNRWRIQAGNTASVTVAYKLYCHEMSVRTNWVDSGFAFLTGAGTFLTLPDRMRSPHRVTVELPAAWKTSISGLALVNGQPNHYEAPDFDTLVDSPIVAGNPAVYEFEVEGRKHYLVNEGENGAWDGPRAMRDLEKIVRENLRLWGSLPYDKYVFINLLTGSGGGLEHRNSTVLMASRFSMRTKAGYLGDMRATPPQPGWLSLASHEYFHAWNVKRLRPVELGPFDYENEVYTSNLWVAEGFTEYYASLVLARAGLIPTDEYAATLSALIDSVESVPGRLTQPVSGASYDAWIKLYRPDENTANTTISYYSKGALVGFLLDAHIRRLTKGVKSLDDVMRLAYSRYSGEHGYTTAQFRQTAAEVAGADLGPWFEHAVDSAKEMDYSEALQWLGLRWAPQDASKQQKDPAGWLGVKTRNDAGRLVISQVPRGTPAFDAGLNADDEILALDDNRVRPDQLDRRLSELRPGDRVNVLVARRDLLQRIPVTLGAAPQKRKLEIDPNASAEQKEHLKAYLRQP